MERYRKLALRGVSALAGAAVLYHEVYISDTAEPLLIFLGLWLLGIPPALFLDGLRKITTATNAAVDEVAERVEQATGGVEVPGRRRDDEEAPETS
jgi:hypothetical protein